MAGFHPATRVIIALAAYWLPTSIMAQQVTPVPGKLETYRDWTIGCDNGGRCQAVSLVPEDEADLDNTANVIISRDGGMAEPEIGFHMQSSHPGMVYILIDGTLAASVKPQGEDLKLSGAPASGLIRSMARGNKLELRFAGKSIAHASLNGSAAALRYMDAEQGRAGTVTAMVATGRLGASAVRKPSALPVIRYAVVPQVKANALWQTERTSANTLAQCTDEYDPNTEAEVYPLGHGRELVLLPCGAGAYNFSSVPLIATGQPGRRSFALARFDYAPGWSDNARKPMLVNASWNAKTATLGSYAKGRGLGDCGSSESYAWDGDMFRLTQASAMGECRGAWEWITLFRARTLAKQ